MVSLILMRETWSAASRVAVDSYLQCELRSSRATAPGRLYGAFLAFPSGLQLIRRAQRHQHRRLRALAGDAVWSACSTAVVVSVICAFLATKNLASQHLTGASTLDLTPRFGLWSVAGLAFVVADLLAVYSRWPHHHVAGPWYVRAVHHSQTDLNVLSDNRQHLDETIASGAVAYIPARLFGLNSPDALTPASLTMCFSAFVHTNCQTSPGPLRSTFVCPRVRSVHRSVSQEHANSKNGTDFRSWDLLLRTRSRDVSTYPATVVHGPGFCDARSIKPLSSVPVGEADCAFGPSRPPTKCRIRGHVVQGQHADAKCRPAIRVLRCLRMSPRRATGFQPRNSRCAFRQERFSRRERRKKVDAKVSNPTIKPIRPTSVGGSGGKCRSIKSFAGHFERTAIGQVA